MPITVDKTLTKLNTRVYEAIRTCWQIYGEGPSQYNLQRACGCSSTSIQNSLRILRSRGYIVSPKFAIKSAKPSDPDRVLLNDDPDPFAELEEPEKFWRDQ